MPYSLGMIHWHKMGKAEVRQNGNDIYSDDIINVSFDRASKVIATDKNGNVKYKPRIKKNKKTKTYSLEIVEELKTDVSIAELRKGLYLGILLLFKTGLRISELAALKKCDISDNAIHVNRTEICYEDANGNRVYEVRDFPKTEVGIRDAVIPSNY